MPHLSELLSQVAPSPTIAMSNRAAALREAGADVIVLSAGEPDMGTPAHIKAAAKAAIDAGHTGYTAVDGMATLKAAVAAKFRRDNGLDYDVSQITVSAGGKQVLYNALRATLDPGDEVIVPAPYWASYPDMVRLCGGAPVIVPTTPADGFRLRPRALAAAIGPRTKWLILNSPGNPTGAGYRAADLAALAEVLAAYPDVMVLSDDIYEHIAYDGFEFATMAAVAPDLAPRVLTLNGVSKAYAMTGWRIGYAGGPKELIDGMRKVQSQTTSNPSSIGQHAAVAALEGPQEMVAEFAAIFQTRRDLVVDRLNAIDGIDCPRPEGAFYVYPSVAGLIGRTTAAGRRLEDDRAVAEALLEEVGVATVFGGAFGLSPYIRISYASSQAELDRALDRIARFVAACG